MRNIALGIVAAVAATAAFSAPASAQGYYGGRYWNGSPYDTNRDGHVDARENRAAQRDAYHAGFSPYDFNRDGRVDARENEVARRDAGYGYGRYGGYDDYAYDDHSPYDLNRDGRVTRREMRQAQRMQRSWR